MLHFTRASREWTARLLAIDVARADRSFQLIPLKPDLSLVHCQVGLLLSFVIECDARPGFRVCRNRVQLQICHEAMPTATTSGARVWANHTAKVAHKKCVVINDLIEKGDSGGDTVARDSCIKSRL